MRNPMFFRSVSDQELAKSPQRSTAMSHNKGEKVRTAKRLRSIEVSYSSTLLLLWALLLALMSWKTEFRLQAGTILLLCTVALTSEHGESRLLMPLIFLSEQCLDHALNLGHSPILFYASTLLSYLSLVVTKAEKMGKSAWDRNVILETFFYALVGLSVVYFILKDKVISLGAIAYVVSGHIAFLKLVPKLGDNEAILVSSVIGFYICDIFVNNNLSRDGGRDSILLFNAPGYLTSYTHIASRGMILCAIYLVSVISLSSRLCLVPVSRNSKSSVREVSQKGITIIFWTSVGSIAVVLAAVISYQFQENCFKWLYAYIASSRFRTWTLVVWLLGIPFSVGMVDILTRSLRTVVRRKMFHFIAVLSFTPAAMIDPPFLAFALSTAISLSVVVEVARYYKVYGANHVSYFIARHIDSRDQLNGVVRSHIYLMYGLGVSLMMRYRHHQASAVPTPAILELSINIIPGIVSLGIVDSCAAIIGSTVFLSSRRALGRYLKNKIFTERANTSITHKTTTGTIGGFLCGLVFWILILAIAEVPLLLPVWYTFTMIAVCTLTECFMDGIDNLQLPLVVLGAVYSLFAILMPVREMWANPAISRPNPTTASSLASALTSPWINFPTKM